MTGKPTPTPNVHEEGGSEVVRAGGGERSDERVGRLDGLRLREGDQPLVGQV